MRDRVAGTMISAGYAASWIIAGARRVPWVVLTVLTLFMALFFSPGDDVAVIRAAQARAEAVPQIRWLAMGDSYSAGEGAKGVGNSSWSGPGTRDENQSCHRSNNAWAPLAYVQLQNDARVNITSLDFVACSGATIGASSNDLQMQVREAAAHNPDGRYNLITFTFGGNDLGFANIAHDCLGILALSGPRRPGCTKFDSDYAPQLATIRDLLPGLITTVKNELLAPGGHIIILGYPLIIADPKRWPDFLIGTSPWCSGFVKNDAAPLRALGRMLNETIQYATAGDPSVRFVPVADDFESHLLCSGYPGNPDEWMNGYPLPLPESVPRSFHPNNVGYAHEAKLVADIIPTLDWSHLEEQPPRLWGYGIDFSVAIPTGWHQIPFRFYPNKDHPDVHDSLMGFPDGCHLVKGECSAIASISSCLGFSMPERIQANLNEIINMPNISEINVISQGPVQVGRRQGYEIRFTFSNSYHEFTAALVGAPSGFARPDSDGKREFSGVFVMVPTDIANAPAPSVIDQIIDSAKVVGGLEQSQ